MAKVKEFEPLSSGCVCVCVCVLMSKSMSQFLFLVTKFKVWSRNIVLQYCVVSVPAIGWEREVVNSHFWVCPTLCAGMLGYTGLMMSVDQGERIVALASGVCFVLMGKSMSNFWFWSQKFQLWSVLLCDTMWRGWVTLFCSTLLRVFRQLVGTLKLSILPVSVFQSVSVCLSVCLDEQINIKLPILVSEFILLSGTQCEQAWRSCVEPVLQNCVVSVPAISGQGRSGEFSLFSVSHPFCAWILCLPVWWCWGHKFRGLMWWRRELEPLPPVFVHFGEQLCVLVTEVRTLEW